MTQQNNGGYYAIKGFLYQFDKTLIEILTNPTKKIYVEHTQDINYVNYVIQVKHRETQKYADNTIRNAVIQLIELFKEDKSQSFCLYCHFKDKPPSQWKLNTSELDKILGPKKLNYLSYLKNEFTDNFVIQFSENFEAQFKSLITLIASSFSLSNADKSYIYHSIFRSKLFDLSIKSFEERQIEKKDLNTFIEATERTIFYDAYATYLGQDKYEKLMRKEYFTFNKANIDNFERLFIIDCIEDVNLVDVNKIVNCISRKYFRKNKSPQPYLCFVNLDDDKLIQLKQELIDQGIFFNDGTYFNGDRFRLNKILENNIDDDTIKVKIINPEHMVKVLRKIVIKEFYQFYNLNPIDIITDQKHIKIQIKATNQILKMLL